MTREYKATVTIPEEYVKFLLYLVEEGYADDINDAMCACIEYTSEDFGELAWFKEEGKNEQNEDEGS